MSIFIRLNIRKFYLCFVTHYLQTIAFFQGNWIFTGSKCIYFNCSNYISENQHGIVKGRSSVITFTQIMREVLNCAGQVDVIYTNFNKTFNRLDPPKSMVFFRLNTRIDIILCNFRYFRSGKCIANQSFLKDRSLEPFYL